MVVHCRSGKRSADAIHFLQTAGFKKLLNLKGGVLAWADEVDPTHAEVLKISCAAGQAKGIKGAALVSLSNLKF